MREDTVNEVLQFVEENDVKFVRLAFCDLFGTLEKYIYHGRRAARCLCTRRFL